MHEQKKSEYYKWKRIHNYKCNYQVEIDSRQFSEMGDEVKAEVDVVKADLSDFMSNVKLDGAGDQQKDTNENCEKRKLIRTWLNHSMKVKITDGRTIIGIFLCTDKHSNLILGSCHEYFDISGNS